VISLKACHLSVCDWFKRRKCWCHYFERWYTTLAVLYFDFLLSFHLVRGCCLGGRVWDLTPLNQLIDKGKCWSSVYVVLTKRLRIRMRKRKLSSKLFVVHMYEFSYARLMFSHWFFNFLCNLPSGSYEFYIRYLW
jgi:hypothetical protein